MASSKGKKQSIDDLLSVDVPQGPIRRGAGMRISTEENASGEVEQPSSPTSIAQSHNRTIAPTRVNRGYKLREDLIKQCKRLALDEDRMLYEVMEEALEEYLARKQAAKNKPS
jgi:hypothetical protein